MKESKILKAHLEKSSENAGRKILKSARSSCLENALHQWNVRAEIYNSDLNITGEGLQNKALEFHDTLLNEYENSLTAATKNTKQFQGFERLAAKLCEQKENNQQATMC